MSAYVDGRGGRDVGGVTALRGDPSMKRLGNSPFGVFPFTVSCWQLIPCSILLLFPRLFSIVVPVELLLLFLSPIVKG